ESIWKNSNFLIFLLYFSFWTLAVNLSAPFFNLYMLDTLDLDVSYVTIYNSLQAGATLLMLILWGKLADKIGNRPILICIGILVAVTPMLWLGISANRLDIWLWFPLLHIFLGGTWAAIDLCSNNIQLAIA
ncbi:MAG: MFS transporter, partial [Nostoc sp.]